MQLTSNKIEDRVKAYTELAKFKDKEMTRVVFFKTLHITVKERSIKVIPLILQCINNCLESKEK